MFGKSDTSSGSDPQSTTCVARGTYRYEPLCGKGQTGGACSVVARCGNDGTLMHQYYTPVNGYEQDRGLTCLEDGQATPAITQRIVLRALKRITIPKSTIVVQPPGGRTLVNFDTLFHTKAQTINRSVRLLGKRVSLQITPASYTWHHGDGTSQTTRSPGLAYNDSIPMDRYISHQYVDAHVTTHPSVDVAYTARYRVGHGPWLAVTGTVTIKGPTVNLRVIEGRATLLSTHR